MNQRQRNKNKQGKTSLLGGKNASLLCLQVYFLKATSAVVSGRGGGAVGHGREGRATPRIKAGLAAGQKCYACVTLNVAVLHRHPNLPPRSIYLRQSILA